MKNKLILLLFLSYLLPVFCLANKTDSLLRVLDRTVSQRVEYARNKENKIRELKQKKRELKSLNDIYIINQEIIHQYETFICDSAELYINENIQIATELRNEEYLSESKLNLAFTYALSGLFTQAIDVLSAMKYEELPHNLQIVYCWTFIRYYENLMKYTDDVKFTNSYHLKKEAYRDTVMTLLGAESNEYAKEKAFKLQEAGEFQKAIDILTPIFQEQDPGTHSYAMVAMSLAKIYKLHQDKGRKTFPDIRQNQAEWSKYLMIRFVRRCSA